MSNSNDDNTNDVPSRIDELLATIRNGAAVDASADARNSGADACRTVLRGLDPSSPPHPPPPPRNAPPSSSANGMFAGTPIGAALGALGSVPREQVLELIVTGVRALFAQGSPTYQSRPPAAPPRKSGGKS